MAFDFSEFKSYTENFKKMSDSFEEWITSFMLKQGMRFIAEVKPRTPVDTGDLRNHWKLDGVTLDGREVKCWFINPMEYASHVEYGHAPPYMSGKIREGQDGWVDGYFMCTVSIDVIERNLPRHFDREFKKFLLSLEVL